ncbi:hypothetical protein DMUE_5479, partial [Dictyocoela muelleri]
MPLTIETAAKDYYNINKCTNQEITFDEIKNSVYFQNFIVVPNLSQAIILCADFLKKNKVYIDYAIQSVTIDGRTVELFDDSDKNSDKSKNMTSIVQEQLKQLISTYNPKEKIGRYNGFKHKIILK